MASQNMSEEDFAKMMKGRPARVRGGVENATMMLAKRQDGGGVAREEMPASDANAPRKRASMFTGGATPPAYRGSLGSTAARNSLKPVSNPAPSPTNQQFFVPGIMPGQNIIIGRATRWLYRKEKKAWGQRVAFAIREAQLVPMRRVRITWDWVERNRRRDPDNFTGLSKKFILDALVTSGILADDGWDEIAGWTDRWYQDADNPGVLIGLEEAP